MACYDIVRRVIEELDAFASFKPPLFSSVLFSNSTYLFLRKNVLNGSIFSLLKGLKEMQKFYRRTLHFRAFIFSLLACFITSFFAPILGLNEAFTIFPVTACFLAITFIFLGDYVIYRAHMPVATRLFALQAKEARAVAQLLISLHSGSLKTLKVFYPRYYDVTVVGRAITFNPFLMVKLLVATKSRS